jgi:hypothetical protein
MIKKYKKEYLWLLDLSANFYHLSHNNFKLALKIMNPTFSPFL